MRKDWETLHKKAMDEMSQYWRDSTGDAMTTYRDGIAGVRTVEIDDVLSRMYCLEQRVGELEQGGGMKIDPSILTCLIEQAVHEAVDKLRNDFVMDHLVD